MTWGFENRSVAIRVKAGRGDATHVEDRLGSAASNPYLALSGMLVAMLDGIARRVEPPPPLQVNAYNLEELVPLPRTLEDSLAAFEADEALRGALDPAFVQAFLAVKRHEIDKARTREPRLRRRRVARPGDRAGSSTSSCSWRERVPPVSRARADVLIVGAGAAGGVVGRRLAEAGMDVLCLEQGDWPDRGRLPRAEARLGAPGDEAVGAGPERPRAPGRLPDRRLRAPTSCR